MDKPDDRMRRITAFWIPRRFLTDTHDVAVEPFLEWANSTIEKRGLVTADGQVWTERFATIQHPWSHYDPEALDDIPERRAWGQDQQSYFGIADPFQTGDDDDVLTSSFLDVSIGVSYLSEEERIAGLVHGTSDGHSFYCTCHYASVVYTTRHRLVCMSCGAMHLVLRDALPEAGIGILTAEDWMDLFEEDGARRHEPVDLPLVDVCAIEHQEAIWSTDQWEGSYKEYVFLARTPPAELAERIKGTELDGSIMRELGWERIPEPPPPAFQLMPESVGTDLVLNAEHALRDGVEAYCAASVHPDELLIAIPQLARAAELLLKARVELLDTQMLNRRPNMPAVVRCLGDNGVNLSAEEEGLLRRLGRLRNRSMHAAPRVNYREGLAVCHEAIIFIDRWTDEELGIWIGDALSPPDWRRLLAIPEIAARATQVSENRAQDIRQRRPDVGISTCAHCGRETYIASDDAGSFCLYCRHGMDRD